ncbi:beta-N-acetylhexosaminidase [Cellulomonas sp. RIT-PI-Y]|uniref:beta-N-acetylhexosaminidase n=1 Tax=Cellulomonas sp. RIT-PI-Y TaxID=3035297 RepID=UPI0021D920C2|nr:beta-N-acetylhexosaminidase [Cellulomonas sp. RIT-PI-Y]
MTVPELVPAPIRLTRTDGGWSLPERLSVAVDPALSAARPLLVDLLGVRLGRELVPVAAAGASDIALRHTEELAPEHYRLRVDGSVLIESSGPDGARHALRTLQQIVGPAAFRALPIRDAPVVLPGVVVEDGPRFGHRGVLLDVARHFMPKDGVLRFIDLISAHKLNVLHLHLTDDQGWRIQIRAYPRLTEVGAWRAESQIGSSRSSRYDATPHGGFYTQDDLREIVAFARTRGVTVVPEIDMPGHSQAAMVAYPELAALPEQAATWPVWTRWGLNPHVLGTSDRVLDFYRTVLDEVLDLFDSPLICLGGDEVPVDEWTADPDSVRRAEELGMTGVEELLPWFIGRLADHLRTRGRRATAWDEVGGSRLPTDVAINSWRGYRGGIDALRDGHDVVVCPEHEVYLDHRAAPGLDEPAPVGTVHTLEDVYRFEPVTDQVAEAAAEPGAGTVLGAQAQLWSEQLDSPRRVDYAAFPRLAAFAEVVWSPREARDWPGFDRRLRGAHLDRLDAAGVEYRPLAGPHPWQRRPDVPGWPLRFDELGRLVHAEDGAG